MVKSLDVTIEPNDEIFERQRILGRAACVKVRSRTRKALEFANSMNFRSPLHRRRVKRDDVIWILVWNDSLWEA